MLNYAQFSSAKDLAETKALQELVMTTNSFQEFKEKASEIVNINRDQWLRVEMDSAKRNAIMGEKWRSFEKEKDLYPYWVYHGRMDARERPEHVELEGATFRIGDPKGDAVMPPGDWNCRCTADNVDDRYLKDTDTKVSKGEDFLDKKDSHGEYYVDPAFRYSPGKQVLPNDSSYSEVLKSANKLSGGNFGL